MISLAANGYAELYELLDRGEVPIEFIKCPLSPDSQVDVDRALSYRPVVLHCWGPPGYSATQPVIPEPELLRDLAQKTGTPFVSVHLEYEPERDGSMDADALLARIREQVDLLRELAQKQILLENVPFYPWQNKPRWGTDPELITAAVEASEAAFLLDLAHARVAAWHRGDDIRDYLAALPLHKAREVHISGPRMAEEGLRDRHMALTEEDYDLLDWVMTKAPMVEIVTVEYAGKRAKTAHYGEADGPDLLLQQLVKLDVWRRRL